MRIGILEPDRSQLDLLYQALTAVGHACQPFEKGRDLQHRLQRDSIDLMLIDWSVQDVTAKEILRWAKEHVAENLPVIFIAEVSNQADISAGLLAGADDYLIKPVRRSELAARVQVQLRRVYPEQYRDEHQRFGGYSFAPQSGRVLLNEQLLVLTQKEFELALFLFNNLGRPLSRATIHEAVWSQDFDIPTRTLDTHISRVRNKLHLVPENGYRLVPVYSFGYRLEQISDKVDR